MSSAEALARRQALFRVLRLDGLGAAALGDLLLLVANLGDQARHLPHVLFKSRMTALNLRRQDVDCRFNLGAIGHSLPLVTLLRRGFRRFWRMKRTMSSIGVPGWKTAATPLCLSEATSWSGMMPPTSTSTSRHFVLLQQFHHPRHNRVMRAAQNRQSDHIDIFLQRGVDDHLGCLAKPGINDLHAGVAQSARNHLHSAVMSVHTRLGDKDSYSALGSHRANIIQQESPCGAATGEVAARQYGRKSNTVRAFPNLRKRTFLVGSHHFAQSIADFADRGVGAHRVNDVRHGVRR